MLQFHIKYLVVWFLQEKWQEKGMNKNPENWQCEILKSMSIKVGMIPSSSSSEEYKICTLPRLSLTFALGFSATASFPPFFWILGMAPFPVLAPFPEGPATPAASSKSCKENEKYIILKDYSKV